MRSEWPRIGDGLRGDAAFTDGVGDMIVLIGIGSGLVTAALFDFV